MTNCHIVFLCLQMRHLYVVVDMSQAMDSQDLKPTRLLSSLKVCSWSINHHHRHHLFTQCEDF